MNDETKQNCFKIATNYTITATYNELPWLRR